MRLITSEPCQKLSFAVVKDGIPAPGKKPYMAEYTAMPVALFTKPRQYIMMHMHDEKQITKFTIPYLRAIRVGRIRPKIDVAFIMAIC
jgi:hypothetical protein